MQSPSIKRGGVNVNFNGAAAKGKSSSKEAAGGEQAPALAADGRGLLPGAPVTGLNRELFTQILPLVAMRIPAKQCNAFLKEFQNEVFLRPRTKRIYNLNLTTAVTTSSATTGESTQALQLSETGSETRAVDESGGDARYLLLAEKYTEENVRYTLPAGKIAFLQAHGGDFEPFDLQIDYDSLSVEEVLKAILPATVVQQVWVSSSSSSTAAAAAAAAAASDAASSRESAQLEHEHSTSALAGAGAVTSKDTGRSVATEEGRRLKVTEIPSSYEQVGHLAHMNIREELWPYKHIIGQVILDKHYPTLRTIVNKIGTIENEFRTFPMEVIAGVDDYNVELRESGARFQFNFRDVYWNSRLHTEHQRLIASIAASAQIQAPTRIIVSAKLPQTSPAPMLPSATATAAATHEYSKLPLIVADLMAGVGPFAVPLAMLNSDRSSSGGGGGGSKKNADTGSGKAAAATVGGGGEGGDAASTARDIHVYANDLNPSSFEALKANMASNRVVSSHVKTFNTCGRLFIRNLYETMGATTLAKNALSALMRQTPSEGKRLPVLPSVNHCIMNLPQNATDFLDAFIGIGDIYANSAAVAASSSASDSDGESLRQLIFEQLPMPRIHVYGFSTDPVDPIADMARRAALSMNCHVDLLYGHSSSSSSSRHEAAAAAATPVNVVDVDGKPAGTMADSYGKSNEYCSGNIVRDVSPTKLMICLSFVLPRDVAFTAWAGAAKRRKISA